MKYVRMGTSSNFGNMLSMGWPRCAALLPLAPLQILLNNLTTTSRRSHSVRHADDKELARPADLGHAVGAAFTLIMGPAVVAVRRRNLRLAACSASARSGGVPHRLVHRIHRDANPRHLRDPHRAAVLDEPAASWLVATSLGALAVALILALTPLGGFAGFVPPPPPSAALAVISAAYLAVAEALKHVAMRPSRGHRSRKWRMRVPI